MMDKPTERRYSEDQYQMLLRCSKKRDMTEWNEWRGKNRKTEILLEGADLSEANLEHAELSDAHLGYAELSGAHLEYASLFKAHVDYATLRFVHLEYADMVLAHLEHSDLFRASLKHAVLSEVHLEHADLLETHLENATFHLASVNGNTLITECTIDEKTDFRGVGLDNIRIDSNLKGLLQYNIRRLNWEDWYEKHPFLRWCVKPFFWMSDYGISTTRLVWSFLCLSALFAMIYWYAGVFQYPGLIQNFLDTQSSYISFAYAVSAFIRAFYFSIVSMTTLGFGDMSALPGSEAAEILLSLQVIIGYVLLGALVTRLGILFTSDGPIDKNKFTKSIKIEKEQ